jgi:hypothetical protein
MLPDKDIYTLAEVAQITGFTQRSIEDACREGRVAHRHFGRQRVMTREHLAAFIAATEVEPKARARPLSPAEQVEVARIGEHRSRVVVRLNRRRAGAA